MSFYSIVKSTRQNKTIIPFQIESCVIFTIPREFLVFSRGFIFLSSETDNSLIRCGVSHSTHHSLLSPQMGGIRYTFTGSEIDMEKKKNDLRPVTRNCPNSSPDNVWRWCFPANHVRRMWRNLVTKPAFPRGPTTEHRRPKTLFYGIMTAPRLWSCQEYE